MTLSRRSLLIIHRAMVTDCTDIPEEGGALSFNDCGRPVVALDVDGVLNPYGEVEWHVATPVRVPSQQVPRSPFIRGHGLRDLEVTVRLNSAHGEWIQRLLEHVDVVWSTTWEHLANDVIAPLLGIGPLEVATSVADWPPTSEQAKNTDSAAWKAGVLADRYRDRALVWVDDGAEEYRLLGDKWRHRVPTLVLVPDPSSGLTRDQQVAVEAFISAHR